MLGKLKNLGYGLLAIGYIIIGLLITGVLIFLIAFLIKGGAWLAVRIYPWLNLIALVCFIIVVLVLLPLSIFRKTRGIASVGLYFASYAFGVSLWVYSFLLTYSLWGLPALIIGVFLAGVGVVPIAMLATLFNKLWGVFIILLLQLILTFGTRIFGVLLSEKAESQKYKDNNKYDEYPS